MDDIKPVDLIEAPREDRPGLARWVMITSGTGLPSGSSSPGSCWIRLAMLIPRSPSIFASLASTPGRSAMVNRR